MQSWGLLYAATSNKKSHPIKSSGHYKLSTFNCQLFQLSEVLDSTNHLRSVRVLIVVPRNNLYE